MMGDDPSQTGVLAWLDGGSREKERERDGVRSVTQQGEPWRDAVDATRATRGQTLTDRRACS